jgi:hypothetical protein
VLEAQAQFDGPQHKVSVRLAEHDGLIYLDLADEFWRCVEIGAHGWRIAVQPLPLPLRGGSIEGRRQAKLARSAGAKSGPGKAVTGRLEASVA